MTTTTTAALGDDARPAPADAFRGRLLDGLAASIADRGYRETTVSDVVRHARTSKRTFYALFSTKEECFVELLGANNDAMVAGIRAAVDPDADWQDQIAQAVEAYVAHIESRPAITLSWIRELPGLGAIALPLHRRVMEQLTDMLVDLTGSPGFCRAELPVVTKPIAVLLLGGLRELTAVLVEDGRDVREIVGPAVSAATALLGHAR